ECRRPRRHRDARRSRGGGGDRGDAPGEGAAAREDGRCDRWHRPRRDVGRARWPGRPRGIGAVLNPYEGPVQALIDELGRLPGIGPKSAQRIAYYLLKSDPQDAKRLARAIEEA